MQILLKIFLIGLFLPHHAYLKKNLNIAAVGDSNTTGICTGNKSYIDILNGHKFAKGKRASFRLHKYLDEALKINPDYVIVFVGINNPMSTHGCRENWKDELKSDLSRMYAKIRKHNAISIGITLLPAMKMWKGHYKLCPPRLKSHPKGTYCCSTKERRKRRNPNKIYTSILEVNEFIKTNADIIIDNTDMWNEKGILLKDGIHLSKTGQQRIAHKILHALSHFRKK
jgi:lysophospholipase L1-like esterase